MKVHFSSESNEWYTPQALFDTLNKEFRFTLDPCATKQSAKCRKFFTEKQDGLSQDWSGERVFMNPPYGRAIGKWVKKAVDSDATVVMLIPARTDTKYFHEYIYENPNCEIRFLKGRVKFETPTGAKNSAPFPSMVVISKPH